MSGSILFGYAIESLLKQALLERGNKNKKLQYTHDISLLFKACQDKELFLDTVVPQDFIDYANSVFKMRYPSTSFEESQKAYLRNNIIVWDKSYLFCYDDLLQQLDEELFNFTRDHLTSSILRIFAGITEYQKSYGLYYNSAVLRHYEVYKQRTLNFFPTNTSAVKLLENNFEFFWTDGDNHGIHADLAHYTNSNALSSFKFPGEVLRDNTGKITGFKI